MEKEIKIILIVGVLVIALINVTRIVWKITDDNDNERAQIACLQGGGTELLNDFGQFFRCVKSN